MSHWLSESEFRRLWAGQLWDVTRGQLQTWEDRVDQFRELAHEIIAGKPMSQQDFDRMLGLLSPWPPNASPDLEREITGLLWVLEAAQRNR